MPSRRVSSLVDCTRAGTAVGVTLMRTTHRSPASGMLIVVSSAAGLTRVDVTRPPTLAVTVWGRVKRRASD
jgi:hypothetical protein